MSLSPRIASLYAGIAVRIPPGEMAYGMAAESVTREQDYVQQEKERSDGDPESVREERLGRFVPEERHHYYRCVEEVAVDVVENPQSPLAAIVLRAPRLPLLSLAGAVRGIPEERPVVR